MECLLCVASLLWAKDITVNTAGSALPGNEPTDETYYGLQESGGRGRGAGTWSRWWGPLRTWVRKDQP